MAATNDVEEKYTTQIKNHYFNADSSGNTITIHQNDTSDPTTINVKNVWDAHRVGYTQSGSRIRADGGQAGTDDCNESKIHNNAEKAIFHAVKGAKRLHNEGMVVESARIAANAGRAFIKAEDYTYDADHSAQYLEDNFEPDDGSRLFGLIGSGEPTPDAVAKSICDAIDRSFSKIDSGNHLNGARIAVSIGDRWIDGFDGLDDEPDDHDWAAPPSDDD